MAVFNINTALTPKENAEYLRVLRTYMAIRDHHTGPSTTRKEIKETLSDGSVLTLDGNAVPNAFIIESWDSGSRKKVSDALDTLYTTLPADSHAKVTNKLLWTALQDNAPDMAAIGDKDKNAYPYRDRRDLASYALAYTDGAKDLQFDRGDGKPVAVMQLLKGQWPEFEVSAMNNVEAVKKMRDDARGKTIASTVFGVSSKRVDAAHLEIAGGPSGGEECYGIKVGDNAAAVKDALAKLKAVRNGAGLSGTDFPFLTANTHPGYIYISGTAVASYEEKNGVGSVLQKLAPVAAEMQKLIKEAAKGTKSAQLDSADDVLKALAANEAKIPGVGLCESTVPALAPGAAPGRVRGV